MMEMDGKHMENIWKRCGKDVEFEGYDGYACGN